MSDFARFVYKIVSKIPEGKVATYGQIANKLKIENLKLKIDARIVGWILHQNTDSNIPCHRVVKKNGEIAKNYAFGGWKEQKRRLLSEGVKFRNLLHVDIVRSHFEF